MATAAKSYPAILSPFQVKELWGMVGRTRTYDSNEEKALRAAHERLSSLGTVDFKPETGEVRFEGPKEKGQYEFTPKETFGIKSALVQAITGFGREREPMPQAQIQFLILPLALAFGKALQASVRKAANMDAAADPYDLKLEEPEEMKLDLEEKPAEVAPAK